MPPCVQAKIFGCGRDKMAVRRDDTVVTCCGAAHSSIFKVCTVVATQWIGRTVNESGLSSTTLDIVQPDLASTISKASSESRGAFENNHFNEIMLKASNRISVPVNRELSCLQATLASAAPHKSSHTVPQTLLLQISTRPRVEVPPWSLMAP